MSLAPLLDASLAIRIHAFAALAALAFGAIQMAAPKGTSPHRALGVVCVGLMALVAVSSFFIGDLFHITPFSLIYVLSAYVLWSLPMAVIHARRGEIARHRNAMQGLFAYALVVAGLFTLLPGRIMHAVAFGS